MPGLGVLAQFPYGYLRRTPVPGLDVALGVTLYQIAETARLAALAAHRGREAATLAVDSVAHVVSGLVPDEGLAPELGAEIARQTARGTLLAVNDVPRNVRQLTRRALRGILRGLENTGIDPEDALAAAAYGAAQGALEAGIAPGDVTQDTVGAARELMRELPLDADKVVEEIQRSVERAVGQSGLMPDAGDPERSGDASGSGAPAG